MLAEKSRLEEWTSQSITFTMVKSTSWRQRAKAMQSNYSGMMTVDVDIDDVPSLDRIPTAREFQSFDSSISSVGHYAPRYTVNESSSYDKYLDGENKGIGSDDSGVGPFLGGEDDEDQDWYADSFDYYEQRQAEASMRKTRRKQARQRKKASLADDTEEEGIITDSGTKQSVDSKNLKIYSPPSQERFKRHNERERKEKESRQSLEKQRKQLLKEVRSSPKEEKKKISVTKRGRSPTVSSRTRTPSPAPKETHPSTKIQLSPTQSARARSASPAPKETHPSTTTQLSPTQSARARSASPAPRDPPDSTEHDNVENPTSPSNASRDTTLSELAQAESPHSVGASTEQKDTWRTSKVGKRLLPFKPKSSKKKDAPEYQVAPSASKDIHTHQETIDVPRVAIMRNAATNTSLTIDAATNTSIQSSPSESSLSETKKPPKSPFSLKRFKSQSSSKDEAEREAKRPPTKESVPLVVESAIPVVTDSVSRTEVSLNDVKDDEAVSLNEVEKEAVVSDKYASTKTTSESSTEESESIVNKTNRKVEKAARLIRSYIKAAKEDEETDSLEKRGSETETAATSKTSSESGNDTSAEGKKSDKNLTVKPVDTKATCEKEKSDSKNFTSKTISAPVENVKAVDKCAEQETTSAKLENVSKPAAVKADEGNDKKENKSASQEEATPTKRSLTPNKAAKVSSNAQSKTDETKKSTRSRGIFGRRKREKPSSDDKPTHEDADELGVEAPLESIIIPSKKVPKEKTETDKVTSEGNDNKEAQSKDPATMMAPALPNLCTADGEKMIDSFLTADPEQDKAVEAFLRGHYCGTVADCLGCWNYPEDKASVGATNALTNVAVNSGKLKLDGGEVDIDQAVAAMRRSKRMAPLPIKTIEVPQDYIFPSTSSITDSQAAYKGLSRKKNKESSRTDGHNDEDKRLVKNFLRKMRRRSSKKKSAQQDG